MALETATVVAQIDEMLTRCEASVDELPDWRYYDGKESSWKTARVTSINALLRRLTGRGSAYRQMGEYPAESGWNPSDNSTMTHLLGVLVALRADVEAGYTQSLAEIVHADVFADFLEMATELHAKNYKDGAAVIAGSVLEEHLRKLATKNGIGIEKSDASPKKADTLNAELAKSDVYNKLVQKSITAWLDLRNNAAHGRYDEYSNEQVAALIRDVRDFMVRYPA